MGRSESMSENEFAVNFEDSESLDEVVQLFDECKKHHADLYALVCGYPRQLDSWVILGDCLRLARDHLEDTLGLLEERAG
jgi:hypothetical protein